MILLWSDKKVKELQARIDKLETLLKGIQRIENPDGSGGHIFPGRVGIMTTYFVRQPIGKGAALSVTTGVDAMTAYIQNEANGQDGGSVHQAQRVALAVRNTDPNPDGTNVGITVVASNAPHGNIALDARAQYSPNATDKLTIIQQKEWKN